MTHNMDTTFEFCLHSSKLHKNLFFQRWSLLPYSWDFNIPFWKISRSINVTAFSSKKDKVTPVEPRDKKKKKKKDCTRDGPTERNAILQDYWIIYTKDSSPHSLPSFPKCCSKQTAMYTELSSLISLCTSKESEMFLLTGSLFILAIARTWDWVWRQ